MRSGKTLTLWFALALALIAHVSSRSLAADTLVPVHQQRYAMGTMFDIIVYHASRPEAERAMQKALAEVVRLDQVMSHYKADSDLAKLHREGRGAPVPVEPSLYDVIQESIRFSRYSAGAFDATIAPLLRVWKTASAEGRKPSANEIAAARRCVGYEQIEAIAPDRIRLRSACVELDLGGIGKGYAVDRAIAVLKAEGIRYGLVNAGGSSITAIDAPPGAKGWAVTVGAGKVLLLRDSSMSTSEQNGEILDPRTGSPAAIAIPTGRDSGLAAVSVITRSGTAADALSTALVIVPIAEGMKLLERFPDASAFWLSRDGAVHAAHGESRLVFQSADTR
jgi:thiamine biosynthesis lipoprotein